MTTITHNPVPPFRAEKLPHGWEVVDANGNVPADWIIDRGPIPPGEAYCRAAAERLNAESGGA